ncbi:DUF6603 domain-containing protein, partial [Nostocoides japonicum]|uniref:DUF6603 domain-containing protein n=1 Tax=Nostocoides japonicum TaxID=99481 RepID=UPI00065BBA87
AAGRLAAADGADQLVPAIADTTAALDSLQEALVAAVASAQLAADVQTQLADFAEQLAVRALDHLVVSRLAQASPTTYAALGLAGLLDSEPVTVASGDTITNPHTHDELHLDRAGTLLSHPDEHFRNVYGWGTADLDALTLFTRLQRVLAATHSVHTDLLTPPGEQPLLEAYLLGFSVDESVSPPRLKVGVRFPGSQTVTNAYPLDETWSIQVTATGAFVEDVQALVAAPFDVTLTPPSGTVEIEVTSGLVAAPPTGQGPVLLLGEDGGTRLTARTARFAVGFAVTWDPATNTAGGEPTLDVELTGGHLVLSLEGSDGFLSSLLPETLDVAVDLTGQWRPSTGLVFTGGAALTVSVPVDVAIGPARLTEIELAVRIGESLAVDVRSTAVLSLGPFTATVTGVGAAVELRFTRGNLGPLDFGIGLLPPNGLGLAIDAAPVSGGGFIGYDPSTGRYSGRFQVDVGEVGVGAYALLDTRLPGGDLSYALLVRLSATFPAVQVGFGFALTGVGGLLALGRRLDVDALRARLASGSVFAELDSAFPVAPGITVVGPTAQLVWAGLVTFDLGVFIELPGPRRVVVIGTASATVGNPSGGTPYLQIRLNVLGELDLQKSTVVFDAALVDSTLLEVLQLTGGAAFRLSYGADPYVVLTIGGFYPGFSPTPLVFPASLTRIAMTRGTPSDALYLRFEGYFAVTTNTVQFGASVEAVINLGSFNIRGTLGIDTLIERSPFHFECQIQASVAVRWKSHNLGGLTLKGELSGPGPVIFRGKVSFDILWVTISFEHTFTLGSPVAALLAAVDDVLGLLADELARTDTLRVVGGNDPAVALAAPPTSGPPILSPVGQLAWSQRTAPLDLLLEKVAGAPVTRPQTITATGTQVAGPDTDWFAPAAFTNLADADALARPAFERMSGGVRIGVPGTDDGPARPVTVTVKQIRIPAPPVVVGNTGIFPPWFVLAGAARLGTTLPTPVVPALTLTEETWQVVGGDGATVSGGLTQTQAHQLARAASDVAAVPTADLVPAFAF